MSRNSDTEMDQSMDDDNGSDVVKLVTVSDVLLKRENELNKYTASQSYLFRTHDRCKFYQRFNSILISNIDVTYNVSCNSSNKSHHLVFTCIIFCF